MRAVGEEEKLDAHLKNRGIASLIAGLVGAGLMVLWKWPKYEPRAHFASGQRHQKEIVRIEDNNLYAEQRYHQAEERSYWRHQRCVYNWSLVLNIFTFVIAGLAALTAYSAYVEVAKQAAAARDQVAVTKDQEIRQLRAYLVVQPTENEKVRDFEVGKPKYKLTFLNVGQTPVYELLTFSRFYAFPYSPEHSATYPYPNRTTIPQCDTQKMSGGDAGLVGVVYHPYLGKKVLIEGGIKQKVDFEGAN